MLKNYFIIAIRNITKNAVYSFINIFGLSIGLACTILILLWVKDEVSYDKFHGNLKNLHQVWINGTFDGTVNSFTSVPLPTAQAIKDADSNVKYAVTSDWGGDRLITYGDVRFNKRMMHVEEEFLEMFRFTLIHGVAEQVLDEPNSIVLTESTAKALFGDVDPINKIVRFDNAEDLKVTGILADIPSNSSIQVDYLVPFAIYEKQNWVKESRTNWGNYSFPVYVELHEHATRESVEANIKDLMMKNGQTDIKREFFLYPMERWRLHSNFVNGVETGGMIQFVNFFSLIALFTLIIACINFMNLATARSERRAREVGIRKSVGSGRKELVVQFIGESILIATFAFICAIVITELVLPLYNTLIDKKLYIDYTSSTFWLFGVGITILTGILAGSYPAFYLSSFNVVRVLKGKIRAGKGGVLPRKVLVITQFAIAIILTVSSIIVQEQINFIRKRELGYTQENLITIPYTTEIGKHYKTIKQELIASGLVSSVTKSNSPITDIYSNNFIDWPGKPEDMKVMFATIATEYDYAKTMGIRMLEGRDFSEDFKSDSSAIIINKAGLDLMGLKDPIGTQVSMWGSKREIVGIMDNVLMGDIFREAQPMMFVFIPDWVSSVTVRLSADRDLQETLSGVEAIFQKYNSAYPFEYTFVDTDFEKKYNMVNMISTLITVFTVLALVITGLGLFGLAAFTAEQRTKEIGIRKVLGASVPNLVTLISKEFSLLVIIAFGISAPMAWYFGNFILEDFQLRIQFPLWVLGVSGMAALVFSLAIVGTQAFRAATANPVNSLRNE